MDPPHGGSVVRTATATSNKPRQREHAIATLALVTTYFYFNYLLDAIVTSFVVPYGPPRNAVPGYSSWTLVLLLQFGELRLTHCLQRWCRVREKSA